MIKLYFLLLGICCIINPLTATDRFLWLEDREGDSAIAWVKHQNEITASNLASGNRFFRIKSRIKEVLDNNFKIPYVHKSGDFLYNFWQDSHNIRGIWRRTTMEEYLKAKPAWEVLLDIDSLAAAEDENWVWQGANLLLPACRRAIISLSRGGGDASVKREFDLPTNTFISDGFNLPESKGGIDWIDSNTVYLSFTLGEGNLTNSGYARFARRWRRGVLPVESEKIFEGKTDYVSVSAFFDRSPGYERHGLHVGTTFWTSELYMLIDDSYVLIDKPADASFSWYKDWAVINLRSTWTTEDRTWEAGTLLICKLQDYLVGKRTFQSLFTPSKSVSLHSYSFTKNLVILNLLRDVRNEIYACEVSDGIWTKRSLSFNVPNATISINDVEGIESDDYWLTVNDYTTPTTLSHGTLGGLPPTEIKEMPGLFNSGSCVVEQHFAISSDGTRIPYTIVHSRPSGQNTAMPVLLHAYGGFRISLLPRYNSVVGVGWIEQGGAYAVANIRGGGEYGPSWHSQAIKANRNKAFEDLAAVARDIVKRGYTTHSGLGVQGRSNGGLLTGNMLTQYPELFGAIAIQVPLLDMSRYHLLPAGASWIGEYGNPDDSTDWQYLQHFSPYHNVRPTQNYPPTLIATSTMDDRVHPGHARKMAALMQEMNHRVQYYENVEGGHRGAANNEQSAFWDAITFEFFLRNLK